MQHCCKYQCFINELGGDHQAPLLTKVGSFKTVIVSRPVSETDGRDVNGRVKTWEPLWEHGSHCSNLVARSAALVARNDRFAGAKGKGSTFWSSLPSYSIPA